MPAPQLIVIPGSKPTLDADGQVITMDFDQPLAEDPANKIPLEIQAGGRYLAIQTQGTGQPFNPNRYTVVLRGPVFTGEGVYLSNAQAGVGSLRDANDNTPVAYMETVPVFNPSQIADPSIPPFDNRYADEDDFVLMYGSKLAIEWTNLNPNQLTVDSARLQAALADAQDEVDRRLLNSVYAVPLTGMSTADARFARDLSCKLALCWLYDHRPGVGVNKEGRSTQGDLIRKDVLRRIGNVINSQFVLSADRRITTPGVSPHIAAPR